MTTPANYESYLCSLSLTWEFATPICKPSPPFKQSLKSSVEHEGAEQLLDKLTELRGKMLTSLVTYCDMSLKVINVDEYIPVLLHLINCLNQQDSTIKYDREFNFEWSGAFSCIDNYSVPPFKSSIVEYEYLMVLHTKAILHYKIAKEALSRGRDENVSDAAKQLMLASGVMEYMYSYLGNKGSQAYSNRFPNPAEVNPQVCLAMASIFKANAQAMAVTKAMLKESSTPASLLCKIAVTVSNSANHSLENFYGLEMILSPKFVQFATFMKTFFLGVAYTYGALAFLQKNEMGNAIAYVTAAKVGRFTIQ